MADLAFLPQEFVRAKRDGRPLSDTDIDRFVLGLVDGSVSEAQAAAFAMAVYFQGLSAAEQARLTQAMTRSGTVIDWRAAGLPGPTVDKHSTGGVGDKISLMLAPIVAACGGYVPMISGRGLGHTGGTLDKFAAIPGYQVMPGLDTFRAVVKSVGCAVIGQTEELAPADRRLYAIRDVTATVESIALITASILSKKLAAGLDGLVMDVKVGNGAFMTSLDNARALAANIVKVARAAGLPTRCLITDMNQVLGDSVGNALEVIEAVDFLAGIRREPRTLEITLALAAHMLVEARLAPTPAAGQVLARQALTSGAAAEKFAAMVTALGGPADFVSDKERYLEPAPVIRDIVAPRAGKLARMNARAVGVAVVALGGGRTRTSDPIDYAVGFDRVAPLGTEVAAGAPLARVHARSEAAADAAAHAYCAAIEIADQPVKLGPAIIDVLAD